MGFGILTYLHKQLPLILYVLCILVCILSIVKDRKIGFFYLLFILPFTYTLIKVQKYPFGNQILDVTFFSLVIATFLQCKEKIKSDNYRPILFHIAILIFTFFWGFLSDGQYPMGADDHYYRLQTLKNYLTMPLLYWITLGIQQGQQSDAQAKRIVYFILLVVLIVDWRFWDSFRWRSVAHFSEDTRMGAFGALGSNHLSAFVVEYVAIAIALFLFNKDNRVRIFLLPMIAASIYVIFFTYSRGGYLAFAGVLFFFFFFKKKLFITLIIVGLLAGTATINLLPASVVERVTMTKTESGELEGSSSSRLELWEKGKELFIKNPVFGIGYHMFPSYVNLYGLRNLHNYILQVLVEAGIIGFSIFIYLLHSIFKSGWRLYKASSDSFHKSLGLGLCGCILASIIANLFGDRWSFIQMQGYLWVFWAVCDSAHAHLVKEPIQAIT